MARAQAGPQPGQAHYELCCSPDADVCGRSHRLQRPDGRAETDRNSSNGTGNANGGTETYTLCSTVQRRPPVHLPDVSVVGKQGAGGQTRGRRGGVVTSVRLFSLPP